MILDMDKFNTLPKGATQSKLYKDSKAILHWPGLSTIIYDKQRNRTELLFDFNF
jgi:hypothetical protein